MGFTYLMPQSGSGNAANHGHRFQELKFPVFCSIFTPPWGLALAVHWQALVGTLHRVSLIAAWSLCWAAAWERLAGRRSAVLPTPGSA